MTDAVDKSKDDEVRVVVRVRYKTARHALAVSNTLSVDRALRSCVHHKYHIGPEDTVLIAFVFGGDETNQQDERNNKHQQANREFWADKKDLKMLRTSVSSFFDMVSVANEAVEHFDL